MVTRKRKRDTIALDLDVGGLKRKFTQLQAQKVLIIRCVEACVLV